MTGLRLGGEPWLRVSRSSWLLASNSNAWRFFLLVSLVGLVDEELAGIDQHHHQHPAGKYVVGRDLALVVRVPHESKAGFGGGRVSNGACRRGYASVAASALQARLIALLRARSHASSRPHGGVRAQIGAAPVPGAVRK